MKTRQITVGFDVEVSAYEVARILASHFGDAVVGEGISENGLPNGCIYIANRKGKKKDV